MNAASYGLIMNKNMKETGFPMEEIDNLTSRIIGCCYKVFNTLGSGFFESVYQNALLYELQKNELKAFPEVELKVCYDDTVVGVFKADIIVEGRVILELKAVERLAKVHEVQLVNYLKATGIENGLLINFGAEKVQIKRKFKDYQVLN